MKKNNFKRILCCALCLCMLLGAVLTIVSFANEEEDTSNVVPDKISVVRVVDKIAKGVKITEDMIEVVELSTVDVPLNAMTDTTKIVGKFTTEPLYKGEFVFAGKLATKRPAMTEEKDITEDYLLLTDYASAEEISGSLQNLINSNPGRTIYIPDGKYKLSKPVEISADPAKKVSIRLGAYATITATAAFQGDAMFRLGSDKAVVNETTSAYIMGGVLDANNKTTAISVEGGRDMFISDVVIKNAVCGIKILAGTAYTDVENVNIMCAGEDGVGLDIAGDGNTFTSMRITKAGTAVKASGANNTFRSIFATYSGSNNDSRGFYDNSKGNNYDGCTSINYANGFCMESSTTSVYVNCYVRWDSASMVSTENAFAVAGGGKLNSVIRTSVMYVGDGSSAYLKAATGGNGKVLYPVLFDKNKLDDKTYEGYRLNGLEIAK